MFVSQSKICCNSSNNIHYLGSLFLQRKRKNVFFYFSVWNLYTMYPVQSNLQTDYLEKEIGLGPGKYKKHPFLFSKTLVTLFLQYRLKFTHDSPCCWRRDEFASDWARTFRRNWMIITQEHQTFYSFLSIWWRCQLHGNHMFSLQFCLKLRALWSTRVEKRNLHLKLKFWNTICNSSNNNK